MIFKNISTDCLMEYGLAICFSLATATVISIGVETGKQIAPDFVSKVLQVEKSISGNSDRSCCW